MSLRKVFTNLRHKIFGYKEGEIEEIEEGVYRIYPTIKFSPKQKNEMIKDIIIGLTANIIINVIVTAIFCAIGLYP